MRKLWVVLAVVGVLVAGCMQYSLLPPQMSSSQTKSSTRDYRAESWARRQATTPRIESVSGFDSIAEIKKIYSKNKKICVKSQFDTEAEFLEKCDTAVKNIDGIKDTYTVFVPNFKDMLKNEIKYMPERSAFFCSLPHISVPGEYRSPFAVLLGGGDSNISGGYTGANVFGARVDVTKFQGKGLLLCATNGIELNSKVNGTDGSLRQLTFDSPRIEKNDAMQIYPNLGFAIKFKPQAGNGYLYREDTEYERPTISSPYDSKMKYTILYGKILSIYLVDKSTMKVLEGYTFYEN